MIGISWLICIFFFQTGILSVVAFVTYFSISKLALLKFKGQNSKIQQSIKQKWLIEFYLVPFFMIVQDSVASLNLFNLMERKTITGMIFTITMIIGGFWIRQFYSVVLLTFLLKPSYEPQIETVAGT